MDDASLKEVFAESKMYAVRLIGLPLLMNKGRWHERKKHADTIDAVLEKLADLSLSDENQGYNIFDYFSFYEDYKTHLGKASYAAASKVAQELVSGIIRKGHALGCDK
jgi:hypothetical protein